MCFQELYAISAVIAQMTGWSNPSFGHSARMTGSSNVSSGYSAQIQEQHLAMQVKRTSSCVFSRMYSISAVTVQMTGWSNPSFVHSAQMTGSSNVLFGYSAPLQEQHLAMQIKRTSSWGVFNNVWSLLGPEWSSRNGRSLSRNGRPGIWL